LETGQVLAQAFVIGELALGSLANRERFLRLMDSCQTPATPAIKKSAHSS